MTEPPSATTRGPDRDPSAEFQNFRCSWPSHGSTFAKYPTVFNRTFQLTHQRFGVRFSSDKREEHHVDVAVGSLLAHERVIANKSPATQDILMTQQHPQLDIGRQS